MKQFESNIELKEYVEYKIKKLETFAFSIGFISGVMTFMFVFAFSKWYFK